MVLIAPFVIIAAAAGLTLATGTAKDEVGVAKVRDAWGPVLRARVPHSVARGSVLKFQVKAFDQSSKVKLSMELKNKDGAQALKDLGWQPTDRTLTFTYKCTAPAGRYTYIFSAGDKAGHDQVRTAVGRLRVKP